MINMNNLQLKSIIHIVTAFPNAKRVLISNYI
jgi:hypothetical protein